ncbi:Phosphatidylinositide phosphatase SAC1-B [Holothuria leucospilota]|uniref:Phosphatidylinositol-3-phosphatase SAC1 n=1 Tax=Holothuria leucospilota TaxID=206669 RepID=A0A9Q1CAG8_HOLLE|nr:Phosphatidylinositide phosphatase SAC1-B [Holothuria leucospilota]
MPRSFAGIKMETVTGGRTVGVHENYILHTSDSTFYIEARDVGTKEVLVFDRTSREVYLEENGVDIPPGVTSRPICGLMGVIRLTAGPYLVVITRKSKVGEIDGQSVWKVEATECLGYHRTDLHLNEEQRNDNQAYETMLRFALSGNHFYFCTSYDITHSMQRLYNTSPEFLQMPLLERADQRFVWNGHLLRDLSVQPELSKFLIPVMCGFISIRPGVINNKRFDYMLISRRSCFRAGTRFYTRGLDSEGHAANFVETEQIVQYSGKRASYVQTRGSIPLFWSQRPNLQYKPVPQLSKTQSHLDGFQKHFDSQIVNYGNQVVINLIDHKGAEQNLEKTFAKVIIDSKNNMIRYHPFDFHHECRKMRWDRLSILMERVSRDQEEFGYFMMEDDSTLTRHQTGMFRTNCMDCLDRTNVVQSMLARRSLESQFKDFNILAPGETMEDHKTSEFEKMFKNTWADNADFCSKQYAGTGALKTDFTRTGKRTIFGALQDGFNSAIRYYKNNFSDGFRQDSIDLLLGNYVVEESEGISSPSPLREAREFKFTLLPVICIVAFSMCIISFLLPSSDTSLQIVYILFWFMATVVSFAFIIIYGTEFVNRPKLALNKLKSD